jgi:hypothetical protein
MTHGGAAYPISWSVYGAVNFVDIHYSTDGGLTYPAGNLVEAGRAAASSPLNWTVPDKIGNNLKVRVRDSNNNNVKAESGSAFEIEGKVVLDVPTLAGISYEVAQSPSPNILWTPTGTFASVELRYDLDGDFGTTGDTYPVLPLSTVANCASGVQCSAAWDVPDTIGTTVKVRVRDAGDADVKSVSANPIRIKGKISSITAPAAGDVWYVGETTRKIIWTKTGSVANVKIDYKVGAGSWVEITGSYPAAGNEYPWTPVPNLNSEDVYVRVMDADTISHPDVIYTMGSSFRVRPRIFVNDIKANAQYTSASGILGLQAGQAYTNIVKWSYTGTTIANVKIYYDDNEDGVYEGVIDDTGTVAVGAGAAGVNWTLLNTVNFTPNAKVKVVDVGNANVSGVSPIFKTRGGLTLTAPLGGQTWLAQTTQNITWTYSGNVANVNLYYDSNSGKGADNVAGNADDYNNNTPVATVAASTGSYAWAVPASVTNTGRVKITQQADAGVYDIGTDFKVMAVFDVTAPENGAPVELSAGQYTIGWNTDKGSGVAGVNLYYTNNGDAATPVWVPIITLAGNPGTYAWTPPAAYADVSSTKHKIKVTQQSPLNEDGGDLNLLKVGAGFFEVRGNLTFTGPSANVSWDVNSTQAVTFTKTGDIKSVNLAYSPDGLPPWTNVNTAPVDTTGAGPFTYNWYISPTTALTAGFAGKLRLESVDPSPPVVQKVLTPNLEIKGSITLNAPTAVGVVMTVGNVYPIAWTKYGQINNVELHYSTNGGTTYPPANLIATLPSTPSTYNWDVPNNISPTVRVRVRDANNYNVIAESGNNFRIKGGLKVTEPDIAGITWKVGDTTRLIKWESTGTFSPLEVHYSTDGSTFPAGNLIGTVVNCAPVSPAVTCNGQAAWNPIPDQIGSTLKIRVRGTSSEVDVEDASDNNFKIVGGLDVLSPESGQVWYVGDTTRQITWDANGNITNVKIGYKTSSGGVCGWITLDDPGHGPGANSYTWPSVANVKTETAYICLADKNFENETIVYSDAPFSIRPKVTVDAPAAGTRLNVANNYANAIKWTITGTQSSLLEIRYSKDGGLDGYPVSQTVATNVDATQGSVGINWNNIPDSISNNVTLKIFDLNQSLVNAVSAAQFAIVGSVTNVQIRDVSDTVNEDKLKYGQNYLIKWNSTGSFNNVSIWYSTNGGSSFPYQIVASTSRALGQYSWTGVANTPSPNVLVRVADFNDVNSQGLSPAIKIQSILNITQPENGEVLAAGDSYDITWTTSGTTTNARLDYATNGGGTGGDWSVIPGAENLANTGTYSWSVPATQATLSDTAKVRVVDLADPTNWDESVNTFKVKSALTLTSPTNGTENWTVGTTQAVRWNLVGYMATVKLQYSVDGGAYVQIPGATGIDAATGAAGWVWTIPDNISSQVRVKIVNEADSSVSDVSNNDFTIQGQLVFNPAQPQTGDAIWRVGDVKALTWVKTGTIPNVKVEYSLDGTNYLPISGADNLAGTTFNWTVPDIIDPAILVRVSNVNAVKPTLPAVSGNIEVKGKLVINAPVLNDLWQVDNTYSVRWTPTGTMGTVKLEYSTDGFGAAVFPIIGPLGESAAALPAGASGAQQSFVWKVPNNISDTVTVRVANNADGAVLADSALMKIAGGLKLTAPNGGTSQFFEVDGNTPITWELRGTVTTVDLEYSRDDFIADIQPVATVPAANLSYTWTVPNAISTTVTVRIKDNNATAFTIGDKSDQNFEIRGKVDINTPLGGEVWLIGSTQTIQWTKHGTIPAVKVEYSTNGSTYQLALDAGGLPAASVAGTSFVWKMPDSKVINGATVKVTNLSDPAKVFTVSPTFTIRGGFAWSYPNASGQVFKVGATEVLNWSTFGTIPTVDIKYSTNNGFSYPNFVLDAASSPADNIVNSGTFNWVIPDAVSKDVFIRIEDSTDPDASAVTLKIKIADTIYVDQPDGTNRWGVGTTRPILWHTDGSIANLKIEYSVNDGVSWIDPPVSSSIIASLGVKNWLIPNNVSPTVKIRVSDVITDSGTAPVVSPVFKIVGSFSFNAPTTGVVWPVTLGDIANPQQTISWSTQGNVGTVNLRYSTTGGAPWTFIAGPLVDGGVGGSYLWNVPDNISTTMTVRVEDDADNETYKISDAFTVRGDLQITSPVGNAVAASAEKWGVADVKAITWKRNGSIADVYLSYSTNGAAGPWLPILNPQTGLAPIPNSGSFAWTLPDNMSTSARVKIDNVSGPAVITQSPENFKIMARFDVTNPDGGEILTAGQNYAFTWNKWGTNALNVKIEFAADGNQPSPTWEVMEPNTPNDGSYTWTPVDINKVTPYGKIRVSDVNDIDSANASASPFLIRASFVMDPAIGSADLKVGDTFQIFWSKQGNIPTVKLEYSPDNFFADIRPVNGTNGLVPNTDSCTSDPTKGCYVWTVPDIEDDKDTGIKFRVTDPNDSAAVGISNAFKIIPRLTVTSPNGNVDPNLTEKWKVGSPYTITWTSTSIQAKTPLVTLYYTTTGGAPFTKVITTTDNDGSYSWVTANGGVPDDISAQVKVRVVDASDGAAFDDSDFNMKIISDFTVLSPNGGVTYQVDDVVPVTWTNKGTAASVELSYSTASNNFSAPVIIASPTSNDGAFDWTIPDDISSTARVRARSLSDDGFDISDTDFRIRGKLNITAPVLGTPVPIGQSYTIQWAATGTIPQVDILYDTNNGTGGYPYVIADNYADCVPVSPATQCGGSFVWNNIADTPTASARIKIVDSRVAESDVINVSPQFNIVGNLTLVTPNGSEDWRVGTVHNVTWTWGGTISLVKLYYATDGDQPSPTWIEIDPAVVKDYSADGLPPGGANNTVQRGYAWTIPDNISPTVKVKVADANDATVSDDSGATFKIRGAIAVTSPVGNADAALTDRWVTNETRVITWTTQGTIPNVKIEYSNDGFVSDIRTVTTGTPNTGSYDWVVEDSVLKDVNGAYTNYNLVKIRVSDVNDAGVYGMSDYNFKIDYYKVTWQVFDLLTNAALSGLSVLEVKSTDPNFIQWQEVGITTSPPRIQLTPFGSWQATWSKTGYGDMAQVVTADQDRSYQLYMETSSVHIWRAVSNFAYNPDTDTLDVISFLERDGSVITGVVQMDVNFYDGSTLIRTLTSTTVTPAGVVAQQWLSTGLQSGKVYAVVTRAEIGTGGVFNSPTSLSITEAKKLDDLEATINSKLDTPLSQVKDDISGIVQTKLDAQTAIIQSQMDTQTAAIQTTLNTFSAAVQSSIISLESAAADSLASAAVLNDAAQLSKNSADDLQDIAKRQAARLLIPQSVVTGEPVQLRYRGYSNGLIPLIDILDAANNPIIQAVPMTPVPDKEKIYEYFIPEVDAATYEPGSVLTVIVTESTTGSIESGSIFIETATGKLLMPASVLLGDQMTIRFQGRPDWEPTISLINFDSTIIVDKAEMSKVDESEDLFEYVIPEIAGGIYTPGKPITVTVVDELSAATDTQTFLVEATTLSSLEGLIAANAGSKHIAKETLESILAVKAALGTGGSITQALEDIKYKVVQIPRKIAEEGAITGPIIEAVEDIRTQFIDFAGEEGYDFKTLLELGLEKSPTVNTIRETSDKIQGATEVMQKVIEQKLGGEDAPVVHSFFN